MNDLFTPPEDTNKIDPNKNYFEELVGEGKKFKDPESLAKGKAEADGYIKILEKKLDAVNTDGETLRNDYLRLKTDYESRAKIEELIDQMANNQNRQPNSDTTPGERNEPPVFDENKLADIFDRKFQERESERKMKENYDYVTSELKRRYGNDYQNALEQQIADLDLTKEVANQMARTNPKAFLRLLPEQRQESFEAPPRSSQRNFTPTGGKKLTWSYFENMRKTDPDQYKDPKTSVAMYEAYKADPEGFEDGNFHRI